jgi:hypothetical protein
VPALYGPIYGMNKSDPPSAWLDPFFSISGVVMNVADPAYREWRIRYLMYKLRDHALPPGAPACLMLAYKPGWYTFRDEVEQGASPDVCATPGSKLWTGPAHVCTNGAAPGGPFVSGLYERGVFERALNAYIRDMLTMFAQSGWTDLRILTSERPDFGGQLWSILADDLRRSPKLLGEWYTTIEPPLSLLAEVAADPNPATPADPNPATPADPNPAGGTSPGAGSSASTAAAPEPPAGAQPDPTPARRGYVTKSAGGGGGGIIEPPSVP